MSGHPVLTFRFFARFLCRLQEFVDEFLDILSKEGYLKKQFDRCKLHATIMNTLFRENKRPAHERRHGQHLKDRVTFDAREIMKV